MGSSKDPECRATGRSLQGLPVLEKKWPQRFMPALGLRTPRVPHKTVAGMSSRIRPTNLRGKKRQRHDRTNHAKKQASLSSTALSKTSTSSIQQNTRTYTKPSVHSMPPPSSLHACMQTVNAYSYICSLLWNQNLRNNKILVLIYRCLIFLIQEKLLRSII